MSAPEQPQGVLLRYAGGEVYALARPVAGLVWDVSVAGSVLRCRIAASVLPEDASLRTEMDLAELAAASPIQRRIELVSATRDALIARLEREAAEHARVAVQAGGDTPIPVEVRVGWVRCERCGRVFTAVGDRHDDLDDLAADAAENAESEFDDDGREVCGDCDAEVSR